MTDVAASLSQALEAYTPLGTVYPTKSSGRRTALARWIGSRENPLAARVAVNHVWLRHFGQPLVSTVFDFGLNGAKPSHPELLDWLAVELMDHDWSLKWLHRVLVTSSTYRMQSQPAPDRPNPGIKADADNRFYWRRKNIRMDAEVVRDSTLYLAGQLDGTMGGKEVDPKKEQNSHRRALYFRHTPAARLDLLKVFDSPNPTECYLRSTSVVPQQSLAIANSPLIRDQSRILAQKLWQDTDATTGFLQVAFETILGRPPSPKEKDVAATFLARQTELLRDLGKLSTFSGKHKGEVKPADEPDARARESFVHVLFNHNEFVTIR